MTFLSLFKTSPEQGKTKPDRIRRYECGIQEVQRWTKAQKAIAENGNDTTRRFQVAIVEHARRWGTQGEGMKSLRLNMESFQEQTQQRGQDAEQRLAIYRNIVLMQGRIESNPAILPSYRG